MLSFLHSEASVEFEQCFWYSVRDVEHLHDMQTQQATCQKLQHKLDCTQQRAKAAQERAGKAETLVETLTSRIGILEAELDEANAADAVGCSASTAIQTDKMPVEQHSADVCDSLQHANECSETQIRKV